MASASSSHKRSFSDFHRENPAVSKKIFDAFINHRGPDVKDTLAFALYDSLEEDGFWTFLDDMEIELGDSIESAIQNAIYSSKLQIAIFSPRYAESSWCLDELLLMLETKARFIPIFCDVKPFELRYPDKGVYAAAFAKHEEKGRFSKEKIAQWKEALHSSSLISGYEFSTSNDNVEMLCSEITLAVQQEVGKTFKGVGKHRKGLHADEAASTSTSAMVKKSSLLPRNSRPVGLQSKVEDIVGLLEDPEVQVISVVGMGGLGKTFLLQNVYKVAKSKYDHSIWLSISKSYSLKNLQDDIASHIGINSKSVSEERAAELIHDHLQGKRSLIVLDDLWTLSSENSLLDKLGLPADKDCKIVVTTRNRQVASNSNARIYEMQNLSDEESWMLFCIYAFPNSAGNRAPQHMEEEGRKIVKQCGNLPLAIKTIAASLANTTLTNWEWKRSQLERVVTPTGEHDPVMEILKLSYDSLPPHLQPCFAYLSFFPEDEEIEAGYLINLWIAEGFIPAGEEQWEMAWHWLDQLAQLCMLQVYEADYDILIKHCKIHDLLHDLAIHISREDKCVFSIQEVSSHTSNSMGWCRILLAKKGLHVFNAISESRPVYLRTLSLSRNLGITSIPENLFTTMRGLRVLDLSYTNISTLPASLGKMILIRLLNLTYTQIEEVPECVRHLKCLLFLDLPQSCKSLPAWISDLRCLQHLKVNRIHRIPRITNLRTLESKLDFLTEEDKFTRLDNLVNMTQLQKLILFVDNDMELKRIEEGILAQLVKMRCLAIFNNRKEFREFPGKMRAMKHLESLELLQFVVPSWICEFANLKRLDLMDCECSGYPELERMPNLVELSLDGNESCTELPKAFGKSWGFSQLRILSICSFSSLEEFPGLEEGAMACLQKFSILGCPKVKEVEGLEQLKRLELLDCRGTNEWLETLKEGGEYWKKIKSINPHVTITIDT
ncbi:hypothetical protein SUGI_1121070 [Cryptomeria japonica]|uniref:probable disease resistance protein At1g58390 n=1 Tax=Cryptomeria japonica TaxID=3369 RepID=UPI002414BBD1|nr:probable disease resistance protein At1g58390 [Cryptomeria japonica]GLJ52673.1 hypothetical protein SUGI_1121070 [Cryptomeria japonica]